MNKSTSASLAIASLLSLGVAADAQAAKEKKEKCYGVALAGQNDCGNLAGTHSCAGQSTIDNDIGEWKLVSKGSCQEMGGYSRQDAKKMYQSLKASGDNMKNKAKDKAKHMTDQTMSMK